MADNSGAARPTRRSRKESQQDTRLRLITAAIELFARQGVGATSLNAVAEHAGFSRGAIHGNFSGKDELSTAVLTTVASQLQPDVTTVLTAARSSNDRLADYIRTFLTYCVEHPTAAMALINVVGYRNQADSHYYGQLADDSLTELVSLFHEGQRENQMREFDPWTMAFALRTVLDTAAARISAPDPTVSAEKLTAELIALFDNATRPGGPHPR